MEKEKFNWKRFSITLAIVLVTAGAVGGSVWWTMNEANKDNEDNIKNLQSQIDKLNENESGEVVVEVDEEEKDIKEIPAYAKDWHQYKDPKGRFTFRYPKELSSTGSNDTSCSASLYTKPYENTSLEEFDWYGNFFGIGINRTQDTVAELLKKDDPNSVHKTTAIVGTGADGAILVGTAQNWDDGYPPMAYTHAIFVKDNVSYYVMGFQDLPNYQKECEPSDYSFLDSMIETFRFN